MNNDVHLQALIEKSLQLKIIQYKYPEHDMDIRWAAYFKTKHIRWVKKKPLSGRIIKVRKKFNMAITLFFIIFSMASGTAKW